MKKISYHYKIRQKKTLRKRLKRKSKITKRNLVFFKSLNHFKCKSKIILNAPKSLNLFDRKKRAYLLNFINDLKAKALNNKEIRIDFSKTDYAHCTGMLLLLAEIDRLVKIVGNRCKIICNYPKNERIEKVFQQIGLFKILNKKHRREITSRDESVYFWQYLTGTTGDLTDTKDMLETVTNKVPEIYRNLFRGLSEAIINTVFHAKQSERDDELSSLDSTEASQWWTFAQVKKKYLSLVLCDLGIGIPNSLEKNWKEQIIDLKDSFLYQQNYDAKMIERAFELGRTRTKKTNRGKGLTDIDNTALRLGGSLIVFSNKGIIQNEYKSRNNPKKLQFTFDNSIKGTIVHWRIPLNITEERK